MDGSLDIRTFFLLCVKFQFKWQLGDAKVVICFSGVEPLCSNESRSDTPFSHFFEKMRI
jgi:hypothetical protein